MGGVFFVRCSGNGHDGYTSLASGKHSIKVWILRGDTCIHGVHCYLPKTAARNRRMMPCLDAEVFRRIPRETTQDYPHERSGKLHVFWSGPAVALAANLSGQQILVIPPSQNKCSFALFIFNVWPLVLFENFLWLVFLLLLDDKTLIVLYVWLNIFKFFTNFLNKTGDQTLGTDIYGCTYFETEIVTVYFFYYYFLIERLITPSVSTPMTDPKIFFDCKYNNNYKLR